jgi:dihydrofolate reductase
VARLIYSAITSLDGYLEDENGTFEWAAPDDEVHAFVNDLLRPVGTYLYGRRMYEVMSYWETADQASEQRPVARDFTRIWQAADKVVWSRTLESPSTARTRIEREFDAAAVRRLKETGTRDVAVGGTELAASALRAGLVDELQLFLAPVLVGGGKRALPDGLRLRLEVEETHRFGSGMVFLRYRTAAAS